MKRIVSLSILIAIVLGLTYFYSFSSQTIVTLDKKQLDVPVAEPAPPVRVDTESSAAAQIAIFSNQAYGFDFKYRIKPYGYSTFKNSAEENSQQGTLFGVTLVRSDDYNESVAAAAAGNAHDGPPAVSVSVFPVESDVSLPEWLLKNTLATNCAEGSLLATTLDGKDALSCLWDGLYVGVSIGIIHNNNVYLLTGTREAAENPDHYSYNQDFNDIVSSFTFK